MTSRSTIARRLVATYGGRFSIELGIDVDRGGRELDRWFLAATLFGNRISWRIAMRTYRVLANAGIATIGEVRGRSWAELVALLDEGGYVRYDYSTAGRLLALSEAVAGLSGDGAATLLAEARARRADPGTVLDGLPGWGPTTVDVFLREVEHRARPSDRRAGDAAAHLGLTGAEAAERLEALARRAGLDVRDLEAGLVRLWLAHGRRAPRCPGGERCVALAAGAPV